MCTSNRDDRKLDNTVKQSRFNHLGELHKEWTEAGVSASRNQDHAQTSSGKGLPSHFWNRNIIRSILPGLRRKRTGLLLSGPKSSFQMKVNFAFNLEIKVPESGWRVGRHRIYVAWSPVWSFHSQWWFGLPCHLLVLVHFFLKSTVNAAIYQEMLEYFMLPSADRLYGDADFFFQLDLAPAHTAKGTKSWFNDHGVTVLDCPGNSPDLNSIENIWVLSRGRWETPDPTMQMTWRPLSKQHGLPLHLSSATGWLPPCHAALML